MLKKLLQRQTASYGRVLQNTLTSVIHTDSKGTGLQKHEWQKNTG